MSEQHEQSESEKSNASENDPSTQQVNEAAPDEFKLTIKKLDMPVRPRGVLAE